MNLRFSILFNHIYNLWKAFLDFIYPPFCLLCDARLDTDQHLICEPCWKSFAGFRSGIKLERYNLATYGRVYFKNVYIVYTYTEKSLELIHLFKYYNKMSLARRIGRDMTRMVTALNLESFIDVIIPIPLHGIRRRERGYNQSTLLAREISRKTSIPMYDNIVKRIINNPSQTGLSYTERVSNVKGIFSIQRGGELQGKRVLLIDDVVTTGLTINECSKVLIGAGADEVIAAAVIHPIFDKKKLH